MTRTLLLAAVMLATASATQAAVLTFEGSTPNGGNVTLANGYAGYNWLGMIVAKPNVSIGRPQQITDIFDDPEDGPTPITTPVDAGFHRSIVSADTIAFTQSFSGSTSLFASVKARPGDDNFNFNSVFMTAGWRDNIGVNVKGLRDGATIYATDLVVSDDGPVLYKLNFADIDEIQFLTSGGTFLFPNGTAIGDFVNPSNAFSTPTLAFDNMDITPVPEPSTYALMALGLLGLGALARRRRG